MKQLLLLILITCTLCSLSACYTRCDQPAQQEPTQTTTTESTQNPPDQMAMIAISLPVTTESVYSTEKEKIFDYTFQSIQLTLPDPDVADKIIIHFLKNIDTTRSIANNIKAAAERDYKYPHNNTPYLCQILFEPKRIDQNILSLFGNLATYSGEPHPESVQCSQTYDLTTGQSLTLRDIISGNTSADTLANLLVESLSKRADLYPDYEDTVRHRMSLNFKHDTAWYLSNKGLCFYFAPYEIAPYSIGIVHAEIPYEKLIGVLDNAYFPAELEPAGGNLKISNFNKEILNQYSQICEVKINNYGDKCILYTDKTVHNIQILMSEEIQNTIYLSQALTPGDAVIVEGLDRTSPINVSVIYESNGVISKKHLAFDAISQSYTLQAGA